MDEVEEKLLELKEKVERGLYEYSNDHYYIDYSYLSDNTKKFLKKSQRHILKLNEMLKEQEESSKTQLEEKEEEITVGRLVVVIDVNPSHGFWTRRLMKLFGHEGK
jgi:hypothetical protein